MDQSAELLKIAEKKWEAEIASDKANFFLTAEQEKIFADNFFDLAFLIASFHHLPDEETRLHLLNKIYKELKPPGKIIMTVWNLESDWAKSKLQKDWKKAGDNDYIIPWKNNKGEILTERYYHHFTSDELKDLLEKSGFKKIELFYDDIKNNKNERDGRNLIAIAEK